MKTCQGMLLRLHCRKTSAKKFLTTKKFHPVLGLNLDHNFVTQDYNLDHNFVIIS